jgi:hypothetical protein
MPWGAAVRAVEVRIAALRALAIENGINQMHFVMFAVCIVNIVGLSRNC